jgi:hypothetical protein
MEYSILNALHSLMFQYSMYYAEEIFKNTIAILKDWTVHQGHLKIKIEEKLITE